MGNIAIRVDNLGKQYFIGAKVEKHFSLLDNLVAAFKDPFRKLRDSWRNEDLGDEKPFWALKDVSFEVKHGEVLGIIGRNGSGKSTLLKIISNVLDPTTGRVELYGRIGSLLEVGMGFHPELTGRENIYLSGAIMGMKKAEIDGKLDEIIDFSGIEEFIDTPVKRFSSGMYVRLAFSVASQLDPEILLLDEVLAVGDQVFQKKCLRKMHDVAKSGRTVLFVSHSMGSVRQLCDNCILLSEGSIISAGTVDDVVDFYLDIIDDNLKEARIIENLEDLPRIIARLPRDPAFVLKDVSIVQGDAARLTVGNGSPIEIKIEYQVLEETPGLFVFFRVYNSTEVLLFESLHNGSAEELPLVPPGHYVSTGIIPGHFLLPERHELWIGAAIFGIRACLPEMLRLNLDVHNTSIVNKAYPKRRSHGALSPLICWNTCCLDTMNFMFRTDHQQKFLIPEKIWEEPATAPGNDKFRFRAVRIRNTQGQMVSEIDSQEPFDVEIEYWNLKDGTKLGTGVTFRNMDGLRLVTSGNNRDPAWHGCPKPPGIYRSTCRIPGNFFGAGYLTISVYLWTYGYAEVVEQKNIIRIAIHESEGSHRGDYTGPWVDLVCPVFPWCNEMLEDVITANRAFNPN